MSKTAYVHMTKTIRISDDVHSRLDAMGKRGETFSDIIDRLMDDYKRLSNPSPSISSGTSYKIE